MTIVFYPELKLVITASKLLTGYLYFEYEMVNYIKIDINVDIDLF